jgi:heterodisulfide reductase subunit A-like polyferredoxin/coenzyme F420-reducing hydrogenase delta subunit
MSRAARSDGPLDLEALAGEARADVAKVYDDFFSPESRSDLLGTIKDEALDGVVLAGPSPHYYESTLSGRLFMEDVEAAGIDPNRISVANLHEQVQLAHAADPPGARAKASAIVDVALARLDVSQPLETYEIAPRRSVMVLGAGVGGFVAAQRLLELGFKVVMVERQDTARDIGKFALEIGPTASYVLDHPRAKVFFGTEVEDLSGWCGDYTVVLTGKDGTQTLHVGGIIMAAGSDAEWVDKLRYFLRIDVDGEGFARSMDPRMLPVQTDDEGLAVLPPLAKGDDWLHDRIEQAESAVLSVAIKLNQFEIHHHADVTQVDADLCGGCASCVKTCAFGASSIDPGTNLSVVDIERCRGCGKCVVSCPVGARDLISSPNAYVIDAIDILAEAEVDGGPKVLAFLCRGCGYTAADNAGIAAGAGEDEGYPASVLPLRIPCGGRLDTQFVLQALQRGFDGVMVARCHEGQCHNLIGNLDMDRRMSLLREFLRAKSVDPERMRIMDVGPTEGRQFAAKVRDFVASLEGKGGGGGGR